MGWDGMGWDGMGYGVHVPTYPGPALLAKNHRMNVVFRFFTVHPRTMHAWPPESSVSQRVCSRKKYLPLYLPSP